MSSLSRILRGEIPQRNLDLVMGYCRNKENEYNLICPMIVKYNCLIYLNQNAENLCENSAWLIGFTRWKCQLQCDTFRLIQRLKNKLCDYRICGTNIVKQGTQHTWKFKICKAASRLNQIGIKYPPYSQNYVEYSLISQNDMEYSSISKSTRFISIKSTDLKSVEYKIKDGDIIEMKLDCQDWKLSFRINEWLCIEIAIAKEREYRLKIRVISNDDLCYKILSYQMTY